MNVIERFFYTVARHVLLAFAVLVFLASVATGLWAVSSWLSSADTNYHVTAPTYKDFTSPAKPASAARETGSVDTGQQRIEEKQRELETEKKLQAHVKNIVANLTIYAKRTSQDTPNEEVTRGILKGKLDVLQDLGVADADWLYIEGLDRAIEGLTKDTSQSIEYAEYIKWYDRKFMERLEEEHDRIKGSEARAGLNKVAAAGQLTIAGFLFGVFLTLILLVVLLRIELNTRK